MGSYRDSVFQPEFIEDLEYWIQANPKTAIRILKIVKEILRDPYKGIGKPEPLKYESAWSRRVTDEHRIVYTVSNNRIDFLQCRGHY